MKTRVKFAGNLNRTALAAKVPFLIIAIVLMTGCLTTGSAGSGDSATYKIHTFTISKSDYESAVGFGGSALNSLMTLNLQDSNNEYNKLTNTPGKIKAIIQQNNLSMSKLNSGIYYNIPENLVTNAQKGLIAGKVQTFGFALWGENVGEKPDPNSAANFPADTYIIVSVFKE